MEEHGENLTLHTLTKLANGLGVKVASLGNQARMRVPCAPADPEKAADKRS